MTITTLPAKLDALLASGLSYKAIAEHAKCDTSTIFRVRSGAISNPSYSVGTAIDSMHADLLKRRAPKKSAA